MTPTRIPHAALSLTMAATVAALAAAGSAAAAPAAAQTASPAASATRLVVSPRPGERISGGPVRITVRAGREHRDLRARLNGVAIGTEFRRVGRLLRRLPVSHSHGLRFGTNVLRVEARLNGRTRRATVRFRVLRRRPLVGAGRDTRVAVGVAARLRGSVSPHTRAARMRVRWTVVKAPPGSRVRGRRQTARRGARAATAAATPLPSRGTSLSAGFTPDVLGRYVVRMTVEHPSGTVSDTVAIDSVPRSATILLDTAVDGPDPAGATTPGAPGDAAQRSGIRVGTTVYRAPWMQVRDGVGFASGNAGGIQYRSAWQVLVLDRRTLALVSNRTYGICGGSYVCAAAANGQLQRADLAGDLNAAGIGRLVIVASHPTRTLSQGRGVWAAPASFKIPNEVLPAIGFPDSSDPLWDRLPSAYDGTVAGVGVPTMRPGGARLSFAPGGRARMWGYLSAGDTGYYGFVPGARVKFDTRAATACDAAAGGSCTITQSVGDKTLSGRLPNGWSGYVVTVYDRWTLALKGTRTFAAGQADGGASARAMADYLAGVRDSVVSVTSLYTPGKAVMTHPTASAADWKRLAQAVASVGGTRHRFNTAAANAKVDYSLIGWAGAGEGGGTEIATPGARLRGVLVPDAHSLMTPANVSADGPPAERLQQLIVRNPVTRWPLDGQPGPRAALAWLGGQVPQLGPHPRSAYWLKGTTLDTEHVREQLKGLRMPANAGFGAEDFDTARRQLLQELLWVGNVRSYLGQLSQPYLTTIQQAFPASTTLADRLETELNVAREEAEFSADWFELVESLLSFAGGFEGALAKEAAHIANFVLETATAAMEASRFGYESSFDGSAEIDDDRRLKADELAEALTRRAQQSISALERMGNAIVSDPTKLKEVGRYGGCTDCADGYEEYGLVQADVTESVELASLSLERVLYGQLVTRSFPVWDTGLARDPRPYERFLCNGGYALNSPFDGAPELASAKSLEELDPTGAATRWRTSIMVTRHQYVYGWPSEQVLHRMFDPVDLLDPDGGGLAMTPRDVMRERQVVYEPGVSCWWTYPYRTEGGVVEDRPEPQG
jgi:hypothetical protein